MIRKLGALAPIATVATIALAAAAPASARVPQGFVGVVADGPVAEPALDPAAEIRTMVATGVESVRLVFHWSDAQRYRRMADVPASERPLYREIDGVPTTFAHLDPLVANAARRRLRVLPVVTTAPGWAAKYPGQFASPPAGTDTYAAFVRVLVERYGPRGIFWRANPRLPQRPIRAWQVWNETNLRASWLEKRWPRPYARLLRAARRAIKGVDPRARVVLAGFANRSWSSLAALYRVPGARRLFDEVAIHPYTSDVPGLATILKRVRYVMRRNGDRAKRMSVTEFGWTSAHGKTHGFGIELSERGQARAAARSLRLLARNRKRLRLRGVYWYNWPDARIRPAARSSPTPACAASTPTAAGSPSPPSAPSAAPPSGCATAPARGPSPPAAPAGCVSSSSLSALARRPARLLDYVQRQ
jgi:hypothetical protein